MVGSHTRQDLEVAGCHMTSVVKKQKGTKVVLLSLFLFYSVSVPSPRNGEGAAHC